MTDSGPVYVIQYFGDLERRPDLHMTAHAKLNDALNEIARHFGNKSNDLEGFEYWNAPDPEDDRIVVMKCDPTSGVSVAWHFSGDHWEHDCADWPGGPLEQGSLPGHDKSLYALAMED